MKIKIPVEVSARHCHLSKEVLEKLFGNGYQLQKIKQLSQPSDFACQETIGVQVGSKKFENVRVVGPLRDKTQIEMSLTDVIGSGIIHPIKLSGDLQGSAGVILKGPAGEVELGEGLIVARRHIHCGTEEAKKHKLKTGDIISVKVGSEREIIFEKVVVRVKDDYKLCMHIDTDEGNAAGINKISEGQIL
jgi:putative phosphotransacetylase